MIPMSDFSHLRISATTHQPPHIHSQSIEYAELQRWRGKQGREKKAELSTQTPTWLLDSVQIDLQTMRHSFHVLY